jgi:hypothetical protein
MIPWNTTNLVHDEDYFLLCEITDNSSNMDTTETVMVVKDTTALPLDLLVDEVVVVNGEDRIHGDSLKVSAVHSDPNVSWVKFDWRYAQDPDEDIFYNALGTDHSAPYWLLFDSETVGGGSWNQQNYPIVLRAKPRDNAGNDMLWVTRELVVDNKAPWLDIYSINGFINSNDLVVMGGGDADIVVYTMDDDIANLDFWAVIAGQIYGIGTITAYDSQDPVTGMYSYSITVPTSWASWPAAGSRAPRATPTWPAPPSSFRHPASRSGIPTASMKADLRGRPRLALAPRCLPTAT